MQPRCEKINTHEKIDIFSPTFSIFCCCIATKSDYNIEYIYTHATSDWIYVKNEELDNGSITAVYSDESLGKGLIHLNIKSKGQEIYVGSPLGTMNTQEFVPTGDYNPATKKYVDDAVKAAIGTALEASY